MIKIRPYQPFAIYIKPTTVFIQVFYKNKFIGNLLDNMCITLEDVVDKNTMLTKDKFYSRHIKIYEQEKEAIVNILNTKLNKGELNDFI